MTNFIDMSSALKQKFGKSIFFEKYEMKNDKKTKVSKSRRDEYSPHLHNACCLQTGAESDIIVLDVDNIDDSRTRDWILSRHIRTSTPVHVNTQSGGFHSYHSYNKTKTAGLENLKIDKI